MRRQTINAAVICALAAAAHAQKIDMATLAPADSTWFKVMENMGAEWKKISGGSVNLVIHPGGVLGDEPECVRRLDHHSIQAAGLSGAGLADIDLGVACLQIPMMFDSYEELDYVRGRIAPKLEQRLLQKGYVVLYWSEVGWVQFFSTTPVRRLEDLRKLRLFTWAGDATAEELWRANGFRIVPLPATDIITQLKMHNLDAVPETALYAETTQLYSLTPYMSTVKWAPLVGATILARQVWESIPAAQREAMLGAARRSGEAVKQDIRAQGARAIAAMTKGQPGRKALKLTVIEPDAAALAEWRRQTEAIYPKMKDKMIPADLFDEVQRLRDEYRARHPVARSAQPTLEMLAQPTLEIKGAAQGATQTKGAAR